jgi:hypothetical protein
LDFSQINQTLLRGVGESSQGLKESTLQRREREKLLYCPPKN